MLIFLKMRCINSVEIKLPANEPLLLLAYINIGIIYEKMQKFDHSINAFEQVNNCFINLIILF